MDHAVQRALGMGGHLDGPIKYPAHGAVASIRSPDGHMVGLFQPDDQEGLWQLQAGAGWRIGRIYPFREKDFIIQSLKPLGKVGGENLFQRGCLL